MKDFLTFRRMLTPVIIHALFWIGVVASFISSIILIVYGATHEYGGGQSVLIGLLLLFLGPVFVRMQCELTILFFRMNETLTDIRNNTK